MTDKEREAITEAARIYAFESARAQGLPEIVTDPDVIRQVVALLPTKKAA